MQLLELDIESSEKEARNAFPSYDKVPYCVQLVIADMIFNLGTRGFKTFKDVEKGLKHIAEGKPGRDEVVHGIEDSCWAGNKPPEKCIGTVSAPERAKINIKRMKNCKHIQ